VPSSLRVFVCGRQATNPLQIVIPTEASHPRRGWEAEWRDPRVPQVSGFSRPGFRHEAQLPPEKKLRTENRQLTTAFLDVIRRVAQPLAFFAKTRALLVREN
jgi:hypothetical protein